MNSDQWIQYGILVGYFLLLFGIGVLASRRIKNLGDYFVGGKAHGYLAVAFSARATGESAWLLLGLTGLGAYAGASAFWVVIGEVLGVGVAWIFMAKPFKRATDRYQSITVPDYLVSHFTHKNRGSESLGRLLRGIAASALTIFVAVYVSAQIDATGKAFEEFLDWNYFVGILVGFGIVILYTFAGGFIAVVWSDILQGSLMLLGLIMLPTAAYQLFPGSVEFWSVMSNVAPGFSSFWGQGGATLINLCVIISYVAIGIGFMGSPQIFVRFIAVKNEHEINKGRWVAIAFTLIAGGGAVLSGMLGRYFLVEGGAEVTTILGSGAENVLPLLVKHIFPVSVVSLYIAAVLAAIMSTVDSLLIIASSAATRDFYQQLYHYDLNHNDMASLSRKATLLIALMALTLALSVAILSPNRTIFWFIIFGWSGIAATFCPVMLLSLFWSRCNIYGAIASMLVGFISVPLYKFAAPMLPIVGLYLSQIGELAPSVMTALVAGVVVTLLTSQYPSSKNTCLID